jgi:hypothetical protein
MSEAAVLVGFALLLWFWFDSLRARERALALGKRACQRENLQFLDETVECVSIWPARNDAGRMVLRRVYRFEFSDDGKNRRAGSIVMVGGELHSLALEPFLLH